MGTDDPPRGEHSLRPFDRVSRRECLKLGAAGLGASMFGFGGAPTGVAGATSHDGYLNLADEVPAEAEDLLARKPDVREEYDTVDASDYDGRNGDLSELIERASAQGAIVDLGSGTYEMESTVYGDGGIVGVVGDGSGDATIHYRGTELSYLFSPKYDYGVSTGVFEGVTFDITETTADGHDTDVGLLRIDASDEFWAEDVVLRGQRHRWQDLDGDGEYESVGGRMTFLVDMDDPNAEGLVHRCSFPDGGTSMYSEIGEHVGHAIGPNADPRHEGLTVWKEVYVSGFIDNGFYVSNSVGRNVLWDCHAANNAGGNMRVSWNDYLVGGVSQVTDLPEDLHGRGTSLTHDRGDNVQVVGLECIGTGDDYGAEAIQVRSDAEELDLDRLVLHTDGQRRPVRLSAASSNPNVQVDITDCYWYDEQPSDDGNPVVLLRDADVTSDSEWRVLGEGRVEVEVRDGASLTHDGRSYSSGTHTAGDLGMEDPRQFDGDLPDFYFDYGAGEADFTVVRGIYGSDGASTDTYRYNASEIQSLVAASVYGATATFDANHRSQDVESYQGVQVTPEMPLDGLRVQIDPDSSGITHATIRDDSGTVLAEKDVSGLDPGDYVDLEYDLDAGDAYWVLLGDHGGLYTRGSSDASYPIETDDYAVEQGIWGEDGASTDSYRYNVTEVRSITDANGATATFDANHRSQDVESYQGIQVQPIDSLAGFRVQIDPDSSGITHATIRDTSGTVLAEEDISGLAPGDHVDLTADLDAGTSYWVLLGNHGDLYTRGSSDASYPIETDDYTVEQGIYGADGASTDSYRYNVTEVRAIPAGGSGSVDANESVEFHAHKASRGSRVQSYQGVQIEPATSLSGLRVQIDPDSSGITHATIRDTNGNVLVEEDVSGLNPGDYVDMEYDLDAGTAYWVLLGNHGDLYTRGSSHAKYPIKSRE